MKNILLCLALLASAFNGKTQTTTRGRIEYLRKMNTIAELYDQFGDYGYIHKYMSSIPPYNTSYFDLYFDSSRSIYKPGRKDTIYEILGDKPAFNSTVYTDFANKKIKAHKILYNQSYLVTDNIRKIKWELKRETMDIAGYKCRLAVGKICDSVEVMAYFSDKIKVAGGPEMFGGLPGMILKMEIPRIHTEWDATLVDLQSQSNADFNIPENGKNVNESQLFNAITNDFKKLGKQSDKNIWWTVL